MISSGRVILKEVFVPSLVASYLDELVAVPMIGPRIERRLYLTRRKDMTLNPPAQMLWNAIKDRLAITTSKPDR